MTGSRPMLTLVLTAIVCRPALTGARMLTLRPVWRRWEQRTNRSAGITPSMGRSPGSLAETPAVYAIQANLPEASAELHSSGTAQCSISVTLTSERLRMPILQDGHSASRVSDMVWRHLRTQDSDSQCAASGLTNRALCALHRSR